MSTTAATGRRTATGQAAQRKRTSRKAGEKAAERKAPTARRTEQHPDGEHGVRMHTVHADLPIPYLTPGDITANAREMTSRLPLPPLPPPRRLAFYGGLGALAVAGALDWPVALAIGAATVVARGRGKDD